MKTTKELKADYKQRRFPIGVYQIRNTVNGKIYVGSSVNLDAIFNRHRLELEVGRHRSESLQQDWNAMGEEKFVFETLAQIEEKEGVDTKDELAQLEKLFIDDLQPFGEKGYNPPPKAAKV